MPGNTVNTGKTSVRVEVPLERAVVQIGTGPARIFTVSDAQRFQRTEAFIYDRRWNTLRVVALEAGYVLALYKTEERDKEPEQILNGAGIHYIKETSIFIRLKPEPNLQGLLWGHRKSRLNIYSPRINYWFRLTELNVDANQRHIFLEYCQPGHRYSLCDTTVGPANKIIHMEKGGHHVVPPEMAFIRIEPIEPPKEPEKKKLFGLLKH